MTIRKATQEDIKQILEFIHGLAAYERQLDEVVATEEGLRYWIFERQKAFVLFCCEDDVPVGFALYFYNYSTWMGSCGLYVEDVFINEPYRGKGYGKALFKHIAGIAVAEGCKRMEWACLDWNENSIAFYKSLGAVPMDEWTIFRLTGDALVQLPKA